MKRKESRRALFRAKSDNGIDFQHFWQRRFYDFNVWSWGKRREKLEYMHRDPLIRKLVTHPNAWPWSSWSFYEGGDGGLVKIDPVD